VLVLSDPPVRQYNGDWQWFFMGQVRGAGAGWQSGAPGKMASKVGSIVSALGAVAMFSVIAWALSTSLAAGTSTAQVQWLISNPWGIVSLTDLYTGFTVFSLWIWFRESSKLAAAAWTAGAHIRILSSST